MSPPFLVAFSVIPFISKVFEFENNGLEPFEVRQLSTRLESELVKLGKYNVVERNKIDEILKEQKLKMSGCVEECLIEIGNQEIGSSNLSTPTRIETTYLHL